MLKYILNSFIQKNSRNNFVLFPIGFPAFENSMKHSISIANNYFNKMLKSILISWYIYSFELFFKTSKLFLLSSYLQPRLNFSCWNHDHPSSLTHA